MCMEWHEVNCKITFDEIKKLEFVWLQKDEGR